MKKVNVLSLFDGISCCRLALERAGIEVRSYYASEIDKHAIKVANKNYPDTIQLGDVTKWKDWDIDWKSIDIIASGFPCTSWSVAGKQLGDKDARGALFWDMLDIIKHVMSANPNLIFLCENVKMKKEFEEYITYHLKQAVPVVHKYLINSNLVSAQNRNRYYWTNIEGVQQPEDRGILWGDVRERGVNSNKYYYTEKGLQWLARNSQRKGKPLAIHQDSDKFPCVEASTYKGYSSQRFFGICDLPDDAQAVGALRGRYLVDGVRQDVKQLTAGHTSQYIEFRHDGKTNTVSTVTKDNVVVPFTLPDKIPRDLFFFRYITPTECERLQTLPDNYTLVTDSSDKQVVSNSQRYKMIGNAWTVDVIAHIFRSIK